MSTPLKGRGTSINPPPRYERQQSEVVDDGWYREAEPDSVATEVRPEPARSIISRNESPDIHFSQSINPYRGCEHGCVYCLSGDTLITMADGSARPLASIRIGDEIIGTEKRGHYRRYVRTQVLAHWRTEKPAWEVRLADATVLVASGDHRFLTERGWKFVAAHESGQRPHLTLNNSLMGYGSLPGPASLESSTRYKQGYLCGVIRGDGHLKSYRYAREGRVHGNQHRFRLAMADYEALDRACTYLSEFGICTQRFKFAAGNQSRRPMEAIRASSMASVSAIQQLVAWPEQEDSEWRRGFLGGIFDAEGSHGDGVVRIANTDPRLLGATESALQEFGFRTVRDQSAMRESRPLEYVRLRGGMRESLRFFRLSNPCIHRKRSIEDFALKSAADLRIVEIRRSRETQELFDITTGTGDFIANGVVSHNCYARPSHAYMGLSPGLDFETKLFFKEGAAERLEAELAKPNYVPSPIMLGANTDPYQPLEKRLGVTRSILEILAKTHHPVSIVTKGALIRRDLDILAPMARENLVQVMVSLTSLDADLKRVLEPRAASPAARLATIRALKEAGVPVGTLIAPIIPALTDHELEALMEAAAEAGAQTAGYVVLRLPLELKELFRDWLATHYPDRARHVMSRVNALRGGAENDPRFGSRMRGTGPDALLLKQRFELASRRLGLTKEGLGRLDRSLFVPPRPPGPQMGFAF